MRIISGTDFSERSLPAWEAAVAIGARATAAELWLVHVLDAATAALDTATRDAVQAHAQRSLAAWTERARIPAHVRVHRLVLEGTPRQALADFAERKNADALIVGCAGHGQTPLYRLGGTSERLAESAEVPVLVIRDATPFQEWSQGKRPLRVLLGVDWTRSSDPPIRWVKLLRETGPCDVIGCYLYQSAVEDGTLRYGLPGWHSVVERYPEAERLLERDLEARVGELPGSGGARFRAKHALGRIGDHLLEVAREECADLIVLGTHHRRGLGRLGSVASVTLHHGVQSIAIVPPRENAALDQDAVPVIESVLVPTDLSALSNSAVPFGYSLLNGRAGTVHLLHVVPEALRPPSERELTARLRALIPRSSDNVSTHVEVVVHADPARAICSAAERLGVDTICLGTRGNGGLKKVLLGSVAQVVLEESRRPVFIVRPLPP